MYDLKYMKNVCNMHAQTYKDGKISDTVVSRVFEQFLILIFRIF